VGQPDSLIELRALRFVFEARAPILFPAGQSANTLRGAFGTILRQLASPSDYARTFSPTGPAPSGLTDWPRPFVFRARHLDGQTIPAGQTFHFNLNLFDLRSPAEHYLTRAFQQFRPTVQLLNVESETIRLPLLATTGNQTRLTIRFLTPTELKTNSAIAEKPDFPILLARIRDRLSALCHFYGNGAPQMDYKSFAARAALVETTRCHLQQIRLTRRSTRTGQTHSIGGFIGEADYQGPLAEFLPWLQAAQWTGVGRQTVWGKGEIEIGECTTSPPM